METIISERTFTEICWSVDPTEREKELAKEYAIQTFNSFTYIAFPQGKLLIDYITHEVSKETKLLLFWALQQCNCCERHQGSCPVAIDSDEMTPAPPAECWKGCKCYCRMGRRFLHRAFRRVVID